MAVEHSSARSSLSTARPRAPQEAAAARYQTLPDETESAPEQGPSKSTFEEEFSELVDKLHKFTNQELGTKSVEVDKSAAVAVHTSRSHYFAAASPGLQDRLPVVSNKHGTPPHLQYLADMLGLELETTADQFLFSYKKDKKDRPQPPQREAPLWFEHEIFAAISENQFVYMPIYGLLCTSPFLTSWGSVMELIYGCPTISVPVEAFFAMGQFFFSVLWVNVFTGLRKVIKGAKDNARLLEEDIASECLVGDVDVPIRDALQWLQTEFEGSSRSRLFMLLQYDREEHEIVLQEIRSRLTARKRVTLLRQFEPELGQMYKEELGKLADAKGATRQAGDALNEENHPEPLHVEKKLDFRSAGTHTIQRTTMKTVAGKVFAVNAAKSTLVRAHLKRARDQAVLEHLKNHTERTFRKTFKKRTSDEREDEGHGEEGTEEDESDEERESARALNQKGIPAQTETDRERRRKRRDLLAKAEQDREKKFKRLMNSGPLVTLAFDIYESGLIRVRMNSQKLNGLRRMSAFILFLGLMILIAVFWLSLGTLELLIADFDSTGLASAARLSHGIFFPPTECDASGPGGGIYLNQIYAVLMLVVWTPATCIGAIVLPLWVISLLLATALVGDDIDDLMEELDPAHVAKSFAKERADVDNAANWKRRVDLPGALLVSTMEQLSSWGVSMGLAIISCVCLSVGLLPTAVATRSYETMGLLVAIATLFPGTIVYAPANVSTACDQLLEQLNDVSFMGDSAHKTRCMQMRHSLTSLNCGQGLGFRILGIVVDKRYLIKLGTLLASVGGGLITAISAVGKHADATGSESLD